MAREFVSASEVTFSHGIPEFTCSWLHARVGSPGRSAILRLGVDGATLTAADGRAETVQIILVPCAVLTLLNCSLRIFRAYPTEAWDVRLQFDSERQAATAHDHLQAIQSAVVRSLHRLAAPGSPLSSVMVSRAARRPHGEDVFCGGYVVFGERRDPLAFEGLGLKAEPGNLIWTLYWAEMSGPHADDHCCRIVCYPDYVSPEALTGEGNCLHFQHEPSLLRLEGHVLTISESTHDLQPRHPEQVPAEQHLCFQSPQEARVWYHLLLSLFQESASLAQDAAQKAKRDFAQIAADIQDSRQHLHVPSVPLLLQLARPVLLGAADHLDEHGWPTDAVAIEYSKMQKRESQAIRGAIDQDRRRAAPRNLDAHTGTVVYIDD